MKPTPRGEVLSAIRTWEIGGKNLLNPREHLALLDERDSLKAALEDQFTGERDPRNIAKLKEALAVAMRTADELQAQRDELLAACEAAVAGKSEAVAKAVAKHSATKGGR